MDGTYGEGGRGGTGGLPPEPPLDRETREPSYLNWNRAV